MIKLTMLEVDWKEEFDPKTLLEAQADVGGEMSLHSVHQDNVDSKVMLVCSEPLTDEQIEEVWTVGDLHVADMVWESEDFDELLEDIREYVVEQDEKCLECEREHGPHYQGKCEHGG